MGWLWGTSTPKASNTDPLRDLDPSLRDFLSKESPVKYNPAPPPPPPPPQQTSEEPPQEPLAPPQSLYPDGRYAHLWKTYRPQSEIEAESKSDQEKLLDVLDGYKARKAEIGRAAVENCVEEQWAVTECYEHGSLVDRMRMCRSENRQFERCYGMQSRFLKALGYLSTYDRPASVDEEIQMKADTLYHRMLAQEKAAEEAKAAGRPVPTFPPILSSSAATPQAPATISSPSQTDKEELPPLSPETSAYLTPESAMALRKRLKKLDPWEREAEQRSVIAEMEAAKETVRHIDDIRGAKDKRKQDGRETPEDRVKGWFTW